MNLPATLSVTNFVVALLAALLTARIALGSSWRSLRWFSWAALTAAAFSASMVVVTLPVDDATKSWTARLALSFAALHGCAWVLYFGAHEQRGPSRSEKLVLAGGVISAIVGLIPGAAFEHRFFERHVDWLGVTYRDPVATPLGEGIMAFYCLVILGLLFGYARRWLHGERGAATHVVGLATLAVCGVNDGVAASNVDSMPYLLDVGFLVVVLAVGVDATARFVANARALDESNARLAETQRELVVRERLAAIGELSAVVAHEVRNPLAVIFNAVAGLKKQPLAGEPLVLLDIVEEEAERLKRLVAELLDFARPRVVNLEPVEIETLLERAIDAALQSTRKHERVELSVAATLETVRCDADLVRQAIINLVTNALLAPHRAGPVRVIAAAEGDRTLRLSVIDDGEGIPPSLTDRIFVPFFTTRPTGTGLGLSIVRRVADAHGGTISHERSPGGGATFVLSLPIRGDSASHRTETAQPLDSTETN